MNCDKATCQTKMAGAEVTETCYTTIQKYVVTNDNKTRQGR